MHTLELVPYLTADQVRDQDEELREALASGLPGFVVTAAIKHKEVVKAVRQVMGRNWASHPVSKREHMGSGKPAHFDGLLKRRYLQVHTTRPHSAEATATDFRWAQYVLDEDQQAAMRMFARSRSPRQLDNRLSQFFAAEVQEYMEEAGVTPLEPQVTYLGLAGPGETAVFVNGYNPSLEPEENPLTTHQTQSVNLATMEPNGVHRVAELSDVFQVF